ncbi:MULTISPECIES: SRPBCC domain-containing protein [unclassified Streptomyces]|uniref:SRPBCC domain-containing protein n=1 Tax=unclassified Streptomyces TaxID=2593676 RepID=UPI0036E5C443
MKLIVEDRIDRPVKDVFNSIVSPEGLSSFFTADASAPMIPGTTVTWRFGHVDATFDVEVGPVETDRLISWSWLGGDVTIELERADDGAATLLRITEEPMGEGLQGAARAVGQTQGWTYFVTGLRAHLLHGIRHFGLSGAIRVTVEA